MPGRHRNSAETTSDQLYTAEIDEFRGKHSTTLRRGVRMGPLAALAVLLAAVTGAAVYGLGLTGPGTDRIVARDSVDAMRTAPDRAARAGGTCVRTGPGQAAVEEFLATQSRRFGQVIVDGRQDEVDCTAIKRFQAVYQMPDRAGYADPVTADVAKRLAATDPAACAPKSDEATVCVDRTNRTLWVERDGAVVLPPTVIRAGGVVPLGWYEVEQRRTVESASGTTFSYWQRFADDVGFHAARTSLYSAGAPASVALLDRDAARLFTLTETGTPVHVFGA